MIGFLIFNQMVMITLTKSICLQKIFIDTCDPLTDFDTMLAVKDTCGNPVSITEFDDGDSFLSYFKCSFLPIMLVSLIA